MLEVFNASQTKLNDEKYIRSLFSQIISKLGMTEVSMSSVAMVPQGVSAVALLTESHMSIHTWPEVREDNEERTTTAGSEATKRGVRRRF